MMSLTQRLLTTAIHAGLSATAYILVRETRGWLFPIDPTVCLVATLSIIACWWLFRQEPAPLRGAMVGAAAAAATGIITFALLTLGLTRLPPHWVVILGAIAVLALWLYTLFIAAVGAIVAGLVSGALTLWVIQPLGRAGIVVGAATGILVAIVPMGALVGRTTLAMGFFDLVGRYDELRPFPAAVTVKLTVDDEPITLGRVLYCRRPTNPLEEYSAKNGGVPRPYWTPNIKSFGQVLTGGGVFVITPDACRVLAQSPPPAAGSVGANVLAADYVPLVGWTEDAAALDSFDLYVDATAYARKDARLRVAGISVRRLPFGARASPLDVFAKIGWEQNPSDPDYRAVYGVKMSPEVWRRNTVIASRLAGIRAPAVVLQGIREPVLWTNTDRALSDVMVPRNGNGIAPEPSEGDRFGEKMRPLIGPVVPFRPKDGAWAPALTEEGVLALYRAPGKRYDDSVPAPLVVGGQRLTHKQGIVYLYDPGSKILARVDVAHFFLAVPDGPFASRDR
jgi:hypothetical protein